MDYRAYPIVLFVWRSEIEDSIDFYRDLFSVFLYPLRVQKEKALQEGFGFYADRIADAGADQPDLNADNGVYPRDRVVADDRRRRRRPRSSADGDPLCTIGSISL